SKNGWKWPSLSKPGRDGIRDLGFGLFSSHHESRIPNPESRPLTMLISTRGIEKSYPVGVGRSYVLRRINVDIKEGEFVSIMGPSGAGKSTLLHILGMHDSAWTGEYYFMDQPVHRLNPKQRAKLH